MNIQYKLNISSVVLLVSIMAMVIVIAAALNVDFATAIIVVSVSLGTIYGIVAVGDAVLRLIKWHQNDKHIRMLK